ncbi:hypothetical protein GDO78_014402 [Eleutherodactylus coqui]|uniref:Phosphatidylinositol N-acetylglucosaminyltransferase subunit Q n=1 Tax=Eleutherodactylus coqui TaxID=57060 RepID=A0A8J6JXH5_ELECQ|nr:hypothetical protein GDO78_014402 [Eleutherodactylus coqui]
MAIKIFFPTSCSAAESGLLIGRWMEEHRSAVILATLQFPFIPASVKRHLSQLEQVTGMSLSVLGTWSHSKAEADEKMENFLGELSSIFKHQPWLRMARETTSKFWDCRIESLEDGASEDVVLVYYDQRKVMLSELHSASEHSEIAAMFNTVAKNQLLFANDKYDEGPVRLTHWQSEGMEASIIVELGKQASVPMCAVLSFFVSAITSICSLRVLSGKPLSFLWNKLSTFEQLGNRLENLRIISSAEKAQDHVTFMSSLLAGYIRLMSPFIEVILWYIGLSACLGLSVALSILSDIIALLTFHIYCFYVYGASASNTGVNMTLHVMYFFLLQLFLGTLLFTILLFLLPTTALYYLVFTLLRLVMIVVQGVIQMTIDLLSTLPFYALLLRLCRSYRLAAGVKFQMLEQKSGKPLRLLMQINPLPYGQVLQTYRLPSRRCYPKDSWGSLCKKLFIGEVIYPWKQKDKQH